MVVILSIPRVYHRNTAITKRKVDAVIAGTVIEFRFDVPVPAIPVLVPLPLIRRCGRDPELPEHVLVRAVVPVPVPVAVVVASALDEDCCNLTSAVMSLIVITTTLPTRIHLLNVNSL